VQLRVQIGEGNGSVVGVLRAMEAGSRPKGDCCVCGRMSWNGLYCVLENAGGRGRDGSKHF
jgi:hypothetical protein